MKFSPLTFLLLAMLLVLVVSTDKANNNEMNSKGGNQREAYVTLLYGDYLLPVRVLGLSLKLSGTQREMVVLCTDDVSAENRKILEGDGWKIKQTNAIATPYTNHAKQYNKVFTKLLVWTLTEYRRIVFMDSDTLVYDNIDELFRCGSFCAAYRHSDLFNSGVLVVKPDLIEYHRLINKIGIYPSYDNADQGFLNYYYQSLIFAPLFNASDHHNQEEPMRLPAAYNADVGQYYACTSRFFPLTKFKVLHHTLGPVKPWKWWAYPIFDLNWQWVEFRDKLEPSFDSPIVFLVAFGSNLVLVISLISFSYYYPEIPTWSGGPKKESIIYQVISASIFPLSCLFGFYAVSGSMHPSYAIPTFCLWTIFFLRLLYCIVRLITSNSNITELPLSNKLTWIGFLIFVTLTVPLYIPSFFARVCTFLILTTLTFVFSHFIVKRCLIHD